MKRSALAAIAFAPSPPRRCVSPRAADRRM
ncbi:hypothetical protein [Sphingopyxis sp.]